MRRTGSPPGISSISTLTAGSSSEDVRSISSIMLKNAVRVLDLET
jgi:hypothetical protein